MGYLNIIKLSINSLLAGFLSRDFEIYELEPITVDNFESYDIGWKNCPKADFIGLIDEFFGAAVAYSLRLLSNSYTGSAVRVRRSSDDAEQDIGFVNGELDSQSLLDFVNVANEYPADYGSGAAAAYSLRYVSGSYSDAVVRVRRSSDDAEQDFTPTEITDGTMLDWVNEDVVKYTSDFTSGNEDFTEATGGIGTDGETIDGVSDAYKFTLSGGNTSHQTTNFVLPNSSIRITFDYYIPSGQTVSGIRVTNGEFSENLLVTGSWESAIIEYGTITASILRFYSLGPGLVHSADGDAFYLKNIVVTQTTADGHVTTWYDQSGNANDATQSTAANQPKIVDAGALILDNGKPVVDFYSTINRLSFNTVVNPLEYSTVYVGRPYFPSNTNLLSVFGGGGRNNLWFQSSQGVPAFRDFAGTWNYWNGSGNTVNVNYLTDIYNLQNLAIFNSDGTDISLSINSSSKGYVTPASTRVSITNIFQGYGGTSYTGHHKSQEVIIYETDQSSNIKNIEANINNYYSIYTPTTEGFVTTWYDQSGDGNDAVQATDSNQPQIVSGGALITENGNPSVSFDGINDGLATSDFAFSASSVSAFVTYKNGSTSGQKNIFRQRANGALATQDGYVWEMGLNTSTAQYGSNTLIDDGLGAIYSTNVGTQDTNHHLEALIYKSDEILAYQDGSLNETLNTTTGTTPIGAISMTQSLWIGKNFESNDREYDGLMQEIIIYPSDQSANRGNIETNINNAYAIYPGTSISGLLHDYPNAAAAYSVRQLTIYDNGYKAPLVRVRRSSDNAEVDVYADNNYELSLSSNTSEQITFGDWIGSDDGFVATWYDQSGNGNDAVQATASAQPQIVSAGALITENGKPAINFVSTFNHVLLMNDKSSLSAFDNALYFTTVKPANVSQDGGLFQSGLDNLNYTTVGLGDLGTSARIGSRLVISNSIIDTSGYDATATQQLITTKVQRLSSQIDLYENGVIATQNYQTRSGGSPVSTIGAANASGGFYSSALWQEHINYEVDVFSSQSNIETNINNYFNIYS